MSKEKNQKIRSISKKIRHHILANRSFFQNENTEEMTPQYKNLLYSQLYQHSLKKVEYAFGRGLNNSQQNFLPFKPLKKFIKQHSNRKSKSLEKNQSQLGLYKICNNEISQNHQTNKQDISEKNSSTCYKQYWRGNEDFRIKQRSLNMKKTTFEEVEKYSQSKINQTNFPAVQVSKSINTKNINKNQRFHYKNINPKKQINNKVINQLKIKKTNSFLCPWDTDDA